MSKIAVVYWSQTGNTEAMATAVAEGIKEKGAEAVMLTAAEFNVSMMDSYDGVVFGCPAMGRKCWKKENFSRCSIPVSQSWGGGGRKDSSIWLLRMGRWGVDA